MTTGFGGNESRIASGLSLIIPCNNSDAELRVLLQAVFDGRLLPSEIVIVLSKDHEPMSEVFSCETETPIEMTFNNPVPDRVIIKTIYDGPCFPGCARNRGIQRSSGDIIAFLDVKTIPSKNWLEDAYNAIMDGGYSGVWGMGLYSGNSTFSSLIRDAIYGRSPVRTVPGSLFRREVYAVAGNMISWAPAGEDGDWMNRVEVHRVSFLRPREASYTYEGLEDKAFLFFIKKWWRYYHLSRQLSVNSRDRWLAVGLLYLVIVLIAFNWNYQFSTLLLGTSLVVPHITKVALIAGPSVYIAIRGFWRPLMRGVPLHNLVPFRFLLLITVALVLDFVKALALIVPLGNKKIARVHID